MGETKHDYLVIKIQFYDVIQRIFVAENFANFNLSLPLLAYQLMGSHIS